jgi:hypothetical protein
MVELTGIAMGIIAPVVMQSQQSLARLGLEVLSKEKVVSKISNVLGFRSGSWDLGNIKG